MQLKDLIIMLETNSLDETRMFYTGILDFEMQGHFVNEEGECTWMSFRKDQVVLFFTKRWSAEPKEVLMTGSLYFYPSNVDRTWEILKDKVKVSYPIDNFVYGMREFGILDNNGYLLQFGQAIEEEASS